MRKIRSGTLTVIVILVLAVLLAWWALHVREVRDRASEGVPPAERPVGLDLTAGPDTVTPGGRSGGGKV